MTPHEKLCKNCANTLCICRDCKKETYYNEHIKCDYNKDNISCNGFFTITKPNP